MAGQPDLAAVESKLRSAAAQLGLPMGCCCPLQHTHARLLGYKVFWREAHGADAAEQVRLGLGVGHLHAVDGALGSAERGGEQKWVITAQYESTPGSHQPSSRRAGSSSRGCQACKEYHVQHVLHAEHALSRTGSVNPVKEKNVSVCLCEPEKPLTEPRPGISSVRTWGVGGMGVQGYKAPQQ